MMKDKMELIDEIIAMEWWQFQAVENEGGRADCQDDLETFTIMRKSQFLPWDQDVVESYHHDLVAAREACRNLITEKYGRMMESTAPAQYEAIKKFFPEISPAQKAQVEEAVAINVRWEEDFVRKYPKLGGNGRLIHTCEDTPWETSSETYARGELQTYSEETVEKYLNMCRRMVSEGTSLAIQTRYCMCRLYGYDSIEQAEASL
ncbi:MAG: DUF4125 family protein [Eubacteriaceae bacterium]|nr:DUF4125 family protein [Eubacteriaceae bacterium]